ncbi:MAG: DEAD/DEAH box helicase [Methanomicrobiales archaeon]|nr:DEAD/DEAH box helicase [Methanomicrobiales archaeon]
MKFITHPLIRPDSIEEREYQLAIAMKALEGNTMVVLPTGLGKTAIALLVAASRLHHTGGRILVLAPTKPLVEQHMRFFRDHLVFPDSEGHAHACGMFTGETPPDERKEGWITSRLVFATPQVIKNDLIAGRYDLKDVTLLVVDECHRAVGSYAYVFIAQRYMASADHPLLLAITASPGGERERVEEVSRNLGIQVVETRTESDPDVRPYVHEKEIQYITVDLTAPLEEALKILHETIDIRLRGLQKMNYTVPSREKLSMKALTGLNLQIQERIRARDRSAYEAASLYAEIMKLRHAVALVESQGSVALKRYLEKLAQDGAAAKGSKASRRLAADPRFRHLLQKAKVWTEEHHPKLGIAVSLVKAQLAAYPESRCIVFATYRDTVQLLTEALRAEGIAAERFIGQATKDMDKGLTQKKQLEILNRFREGLVKVLIATSVGEEGLDVPSTDLVVFFEAVPSEIRSIQRKGRTGRTGAGKIIVLVTKGTSDEIYRYVSATKERAMLHEIKSMGRKATQTLIADAAQKSITSYMGGGPAITVDDREASSRVVEVLSELGASIQLKRMSEGDYAIGDRILVERKTATDFMNTLVERDLFGQLTKLSVAAPRPVLIVEGKDLFSVRNIHPNAIRGVIAAITVDMGIPVIFTSDEGETAQMLFILARREGNPSEGGKMHPHKSYRSIKEQQEYIVSSFPGIGLKNARLLLEHFGSIKELIDASAEDLMEVKGIGEKIAEQFFELARKPY